MREETFYSKIIEGARGFEKEVRMRIEKEEEINHPMGSILKKIRKTINEIKFMSKLKITQEEEEIMLTEILMKIEKIVKEISGVRIYQNTGFKVTTISKDAEDQNSLNNQTDLITSISKRNDYTSRRLRTSRAIYRRSRDMGNGRRREGSRYDGMT